MPKTKRPTTSETPSNLTNTPTSNSKPDPAGYTIESLSTALGRGDPKLRDALFELTDEPSLMEAGTGVDSDKILLEVPIFIGSAKDIYASLTAEQRGTVHISPELFAIVIDETLILRTMKAELDAAKTHGAGTKAQRDAAERKELSEGIALRDNLVRAIRRAIPKESGAQLDKLVGLGDTPEHLAAGLTAVANFVAGLLVHPTPSEAARYQIHRVDATVVAKLSDKAKKVLDAKVTATPRTSRIGQRQLDVQDGRVLFLMDPIYQAFHAGHRELPSILEPELRHIKWYFDGRSGNKAAKKTTPSTRTISLSDLPSDSQGEAGSDPRSASKSDAKAAAGGKTKKG